VLDKGVLAEDKFFDNYADVQVLESIFAELTIKV
jgi:hypothetical protein